MTSSPAPPYPSRGWGWSWKLQASHYGLVFQGTSAHPGTHMSHLLRTKATPIIWEIPRHLGVLCQELESETRYWNKRCLLGNFKSFRSSVPGTWGRNQYIFCIILHIHRKKYIALIIGYHCFWNFDFN